jgi:D-arginine dehydrogenase
VPPIPERAEVVVVGAGFAGAATAFYLARAGVSVVVLEREATLGHHASGRNAALCRQLADDDHLTQLCMRGAALLGDPPAGLRGSFLRPTGSLLVAERPARLEALAAAARRNQLVHQVVDRAAVLARWPRLAGVSMVGAVAVPSDGVIEIHRLLKGLIDGVRAGGGHVELGAAVERVRRDRRGALVVDCGRGAVTADCVVVAAGAWAGEVGARAGGAPLGFAVQQRHLFLTERVPNLDRAAPLVWFEGDGEFYARPEGDGLLVSGCDGLAAEPCDARMAPGAQAQLEGQLRRAAPWLGELPIARGWACLRTFSPDGRPVIGWDVAAPHLFWVAGLGGHGATSALAIGELAAAGLLARLR